MPREGVQRGLINRVIAASVLITLTSTFGPDLILDNAMLIAFTADYRKVNLENPLPVLELGPVFLPGERVAAMVLPLLLAALLYRLLRHSRIGGAIVAMRMDREAAASSRSVRSPAASWRAPASGSSTSCPWPRHARLRIDRGRVVNAAPSAELEDDAPIREAYMERA